ncbi:CHAT domain-containing protein [Winogradskyella forsetii]|uniref:CHAT domain-containing protein n=1 Tax=Winogradskyella forsetii TaxID=2686077 RepID=UPI0015BD3C87|nr:CHAT domain-containing protein [Winogradskyella forsetii]
MNINIRHFLFIFLILWTSCKDTSKLESNNKNNDSTSKFNVSDSLNLVKSNRILNSAISRIKNGEFDEKTGQLLDSALTVFNVIKSPSAQDLANIYSYFDVYTYRNQQPNKNIIYNREFIKRYKKHKNKNFQKLSIAMSNLAYSLMDVGKPYAAISESLRPLQKLIDSLLNEKIADTLKSQLKVTQIVNYRQLIITAQDLENGEILRASIDDFERYLNKKETSKQALEFLPYALSNLADVSIELGNFEKAKEHIEYWKIIIPADNYIDQLMIIDLESKIQKENKDFEGLNESYRNAEIIYKKIENENPFKNTFYASLLYRISSLNLENESINDEDLNGVINTLKTLSQSNVKKDTVFMLYAQDLKISRFLNEQNLDSIPYYIDSQYSLAKDFKKTDFLNKNLLHKMRFSFLNNNLEAVEDVVQRFLQRISIYDIKAISGVDEDFKNNLYGSIHTAQTAIELSNIILNNINTSNEEVLAYKAYKLALLAAILVDVNKSKFNNNLLEENLIDNINKNLLRTIAINQSFIDKDSNDEVLEIVEQNLTSQLTIKNRINNIIYEYPIEIQKILDSLNIIEIKLSDLKSDISKSEKNKDSLKQSFQDLKNKKSDVLLELKGNPLYRDLNNAFAFHVSDLKSILLEEDVIVRFYDYENLYAFLITKTETKFLNLGNSKKIDKAISSFTKSMSTIQDFEEDYKTIISALDPVIENLDQSNVTIIPDGKIAFVPLELLINRDLEKAMTLSYNTSLKLINHKKDDSTSRLLASYSPNYTVTDGNRNEYIMSIERSNGTYDLPFAREEASYITSLFDGHLYKGNNATKKEFINTAPNYSELHLAMHAFVDENNEYNSKLLFAGNNNDNHLDLNSIYNLNLNAELITLSACNTGYGRIDPIEGVMSFSRAFQYAGSKATVTSLWRVPDKETSIIMKRFYEYLRQGETKSQALKKAKQYYLETAEDVNLKHPYYWAGFVLNGNTSAIAHSPNYWLYIIIGMSILTLLFLVIKKRLNTN